MAKDITEWWGPRCLGTADKDNSAMIPFYSSRWDSSKMKILVVGQTVTIEVESSSPNLKWRTLAPNTVWLDHPDPNDNRIRLRRIPQIMWKDRLIAFATFCKLKPERLRVICCPGLSYDLKASRLGNATERNPEITNRQLLMWTPTEIKALQVKGEEYSSWRLSGVGPVELKTFLLQRELDGVLWPAKQEYCECKRGAVSWGLLTGDSLQEGNSSNLQGPDVAGAPSIKDGAELSNRELLLQLVSTAFRDEGHESHTPEYWKVESSVTFGDPRKNRKISSGTYKCSQNSQLKREWGVSGGTYFCLEIDKADQTYG